MANIIKKQPSKAKPATKGSSTTGTKFSKPKSSGFEMFSTKNNGKPRGRAKYKEQGFVAGQDDGDDYKKGNKGSGGKFTDKFESKTKGPDSGFEGKKGKFDGKPEGKFSGKTEDGKFAGKKDGKFSGKAEDGQFAGKAKAGDRKFGAKGKTFDSKGEGQFAERGEGQFEGKKGKFAGKGKGKFDDKKGKFGDKGKGTSARFEDKGKGTSARFEDKGKSTSARFEDKDGGKFSTGKSSAGKYQAALTPKVRQEKPMAKQVHGSDQIRLNKAIGDSGFCSRREADALIDQGRVTVNKKLAVMGQFVGPRDAVAIDGKIVKVSENKVYIALNKPEGIECTTDTSVEGNIVDFVGHSERVFPIGRLDKASEGLILLTNHGDIVNKVLRAGNAHQKEYLVTVHRAVTPAFIEKMGQGVPILDTVTLPCEIKQEGKYVFRIILTQGLNRQIRRMCEALGYEVTKLQRVRIMHIQLGDLPLGQWRDLTDSEVATMMAAIAESTNNQENL